METTTTTANADVRSRGFFGRVDPFELGTGVFVFSVIMWSDHFGAAVEEFAQNLVTITVISEFLMIWAGGGAVAASRSDSKFDRVFCLIAGVGLYAACVYGLTWDHAHWMLLQSLWIVCMRFRPRTGMPMLGTVHLRRIGYATLAGLLTVIGQLLLRGLIIVALGSYGMHMEVVDGATMPPRWVSAIIWGLFYVELGFLGPVFEKISLTAED